MKKDDLRHQILDLTKKYYDLNFSSDDFLPGETYVNYSGRVFDQDELINLIDSSLDFWLTSGRYAKQFEKEFSKFLGVRNCILTNSGSSRIFQ